jgi:hypothetical protein
MDSTAIAKAYRKLAKLRGALETMRNTTNVEQIESSWEEFILAAGSIYSVLEQGSKSSGKSTAWFGRRKNHRKKDPLLRYLHFARNSEEHGLEKITETGSSSIEIGPGASIKLVSDGVSRWNIVESNGLITPKNDVVCLARVNNTKFSDFADPPSEHLGQKLDNNLPVAVAEAAARYIELMLEDAQSLVLQP